MRFMAFLVSPLAAFLVLVLLLANWIYIFMPYGKPPLDISGISLVLQSLTTGAVYGLVILLILFFTFCIFIVSLIPKIKLRRILIPIFGVFALCALFYFAAIVGTSGTEEASLGLGWYGTVMAVIAAMAGAFLPKPKESSLHV